MIDQKYQKRDIGRIALGLAINEIKKLGGLKSIEICYNPKNQLQRHFIVALDLLKSAWMVMICLRQLLFKPEALLKRS
ncbi:hypothetical protein ACP0H4_01495 [Pseudomonas aeruginosa]|uniref:hypothetical protein n=1 Tax=Pseudomonas aeruginosa TaxID=287 RepID=UPI0029529FF5|nr:hypothetical protein [Pseudomonas aeruginosa]MDV7899219.1 hypothetical protein [Pseudomonas aeruginosa]